MEIFQMGECDSGQSYKPSSYLSPKGRAGRLRRTASNCSDMSSASSNSKSEGTADPFVFSLSRSNTPANEGSVTLTAAPEGTLPRSTRFTSTGDVETSDSSRGSRPIAIDLPVSRRGNTAPIPVDQPLSGRGDIQGAYFPFHEELPRVHRPHPFHADTKRARQHSITQAMECTSEFIAAKSMSSLPRFPMLDTLNKVNATVHTPVSSFIPMGVKDSALPMGKYYPSNWEKSNRSNTAPHWPAAKSAPSSSPVVKSGSSSVSEYHRSGSSHSRSNSDAQRRLQQYQRDMIVQATLAAGQVLDNTDTLQSSNLDAVSDQLKNLRLGASLIRSAKPLSPKLQPLGSPGPVTPMDLEGGGEYMGSKRLGHGSAVGTPKIDGHTTPGRSDSKGRRREAPESPLAHKVSA